MPHETWLELFWTVYFFAGCILNFVLSPVSPEIQSFRGVFVFLYLSTLPRPDFPGSHGARKHYLLVLFWARTLQSFIIIIIIIIITIYVFFPGVYKPYVLELHWWRARPKSLETEFTNITRRHFCYKIAKSPLPFDLRRSQTSVLINSLMKKVWQRRSEICGKTVKTRVPGSSLSSPRPSAAVLVSEHPARSRSFRSLCTVLYFISHWFN